MATDTLDDLAHQLYNADPRNSSGTSWEYLTGPYQEPYRRMAARALKMPNPELVRLWEYQADAADRFVAVVRQRDRAEARVVVLEGAVRRVRESILAATAVVSRQSVDKCLADALAALDAAMNAGGEARAAFSSRPLPESVELAADPDDHPLF